MGLKVNDKNLLVENASLDAIFYANEKKINACKNILEKICMQRNETFERTKLYVEY